MRALVASLAVLLAASAADAKADREGGGLARLFPHWISYTELAPDERDAFTLIYEVSASTGALPEDIRLWYVEDGTDRELQLDADGRVHPPAVNVIAADPVFRVNQPVGVMNLRMAFMPLAEPSTHMNAAELARSIAQANAAMRRAAGVASLLLPSMREVRIEFDGPAPEAIAVLADGRRVDLPVEENVATFRPRDRSMREAVRLEFGRAPRRLRLGN